MREAYQETTLPDRLNDPPLCEPHTLLPQAHITAWRETAPWGDVVEALTPVRKALISRLWGVRWSGLPGEGKMEEPPGLRNHKSRGAFARPDGRGMKVGTTIPPNAENLLPGQSAGCGLGDDPVGLWRYASAVGQLR
jgi:hypothetical protein